jgi:hypothetical protein
MGSSLELQGPKSNPLQGKSFTEEYMPAKKKAAKKKKKH